MVIGRPWTLPERAQSGRISTLRHVASCAGHATPVAASSRSHPVYPVPSLTSPMPATCAMSQGPCYVGSLPCLTDRCSRESSITVQPCDGLARSVLEPRMYASSTCIDERLLHMACHLGRRLCHADRPSAKSILARQRAVRQGGSESIGHEPGKSQAGAFEFSTPVHTATRIPHLVLYRWLPCPRHHQSACACEHLAWTCCRQVPRLKAHRCHEVA